MTGTIVLGLVGIISGAVMSGIGGGGKYFNGTSKGGVSEKLRHQR